MSDLFEAAWQQALVEVEGAAARLRGLHDSGASAATLRDPCRQYWAAKSLLLLTYASPENWPRGPMNPPRFFLPADIAQNLGRIAGYFRSGNIPDLVGHVVQPGNPQLDPFEEKCIAVAVAYIHASRLGLIADKASTKTVIEAFNVERRTVEKWRLKYSFVDALDFGDPAALIEAFENAARHYRAAGRSPKSTKVRTRKMKDARRAARKPGMRP